MTKTCMPPIQYQDRVLLGAVPLLLAWMWVPGAVVHATRALPVDLEAREAAVAAIREELAARLQAKRQRGA